MFDIHIELENATHELGRLGGLLGEQGFSVEGGGAWLVGDKIQSHFLFENGHEVSCFLQKSGFTVVAVNEDLVQKLKQDKPGQLGAFCQAMGSAEINIQVLYSDHNNQLIIVPKPFGKAKEVCRKWMQNNWKI